MKRAFNKLRTFVKEVQGWVALATLLTVVYGWATSLPFTRSLVILPAIARNVDTLKVELANPQTRVDTTVAKTPWGKRVASSLDSLGVRVSHLDGKPFAKVN